MAVRITFSGSQQIIEEVCEHCGEKIRDLHISEIAFTAEDDPRTIQIRDVDNNIFELKRNDKEFLNYQNHSNVNNYWMIQKHKKRFKKRHSSMVYEQKQCVVNQ